MADEDNSIQTFCFVANIVTYVVGVSDTLIALAVTVAVAVAVAVFLGSTIETVAVAVAVAVAVLRNSTIVTVAVAIVITETGAILTVPSTLRPMHEQQY